MQQPCEPREAVFDPTLPIGDTELIIDDFHTLGDPMVYLNDGDGNDQTTQRKYEFVHHDAPAEGFVHLTYMQPKPPMRPKARVRINLGAWKYKRPEAQAAESMSLSKIEEAAIEQAFGRRV